MPRNKKEGLVYGCMMAFLMAYIMGSLNTFIHTSNPSAWLLLEEFKTLPIFFIAVMLFESLVVSRIAGPVASRIVSRRDSDNAKILATTVCMVFGMSLCMSAFGAVFLSGFSASAVSMFCASWPRNFFFAFLLQLLVVGPFCRKMLGVLFVKSRAEISEENIAATAC